ncbi:MAG: hypothetical protein U9R75_00065 [Candidatus Thermoplasmatota archaeon]|nr:hypothetical protein [Candidatus Thermoplasmatota archaeon]
MKCDVCDRTFEVDIDTFSRIEVARDTRRSGSHGHNKKMCPSCKGEHWHAHYQQIGQWVLLYENDFDELMKETRDKVVNRLVGEQKTK